MTTESGATARSVSWNLFNMPASITYGGKTTTFQYDADHERVEQIAPEGTTYYLPDGELTPSTGSGPVWHTYFQVGGQRVVETYGPTGSLKHHYFHNDEQNSIGLVTTDGYVYGGTNSILENELSDAFGQPRLPTGATDPNWGTNDVTKRRSINQEDLTDSHLIDLNARVYDPLFAKFLSPDPVIADQDDSQAWNAYAYSHNNPMSGEDPTGLFMVMGRCLCVGSGQEIGQQMDEMTADILAETNAGMPSVGEDQQVYQEVGPNGVKSNLTIQQAAEAAAKGDNLGPGVQADIDRYAAGQLQAGVSVRAQQQQPADQPLTNVVYNETGSLRADPNAKPGAPGSAQDLANGQQAVAEIANRVMNAGHPDRVAPDSLTAKGAAAVKTDPNAIDAYGRSRTAADAALGGSNISNGAMQYRTRVGDDVTTSLGRSSTSRGTPISQHYGPFIEGKHSVVIVVAP